MEAHVRMMQTLRGESSDRPWFKALFVDFDKRPFSVGRQYYDVSELRLRGVSVVDFLESGASWGTLRALGYRIGDMKALGGTLDDVLCMGVSLQHLVDEHEHVTPAFVLPLVRSAKDLTQWTPAELFKMGFTLQQLLSAGLRECDYPLSQIELFYTPSGGQRVAWGGGVSTISKMMESDCKVRSAARLKIDMSRFK